MEVYLLVPDAERYQALAFEDEATWKEIVDRFDGTPMAHEWSPPKVRIVREQESDLELRPGDFPSLGGVIPVFSARAVDALRDILQAAGELLPLKYEEGEYVAFNVTTVLDALDEERSDVARFASSGRVMKINRYAFFHDRLAGATIFKLSQLPKSRAYVTDAFVPRVQDAGLEGFDFSRRLWAGGK